MSRYIDANILKEKILKERDKIPFKKIEPYSFGVETHYRDGAAMRGGIRKALRCLEQAPTADVVEVVRCKDCKYSEFIYSSKKKGEPSIGHYVCTSRRCSTVAEGYCHWGERREQNEG